MGRCGRRFADCGLRTGECVITAVVSIRSVSLFPEFRANRTFGYWLLARATGNARNSQIREAPGDPPRAAYVEVCPFLSHLPPTLMPVVPVLSTPFFLRFAERFISLSRLLSSDVVVRQPPWKAISKFLEIQLPANGTYLGTSLYRLLPALHALWPTHCPRHTRPSTGPPRMPRLPEAEVETTQVQVQNRLGVKAPYYPDDRAEGQSVGACFLSFCLLSFLISSCSPFPLLALPSPTSPRLLRPGPDIIALQFSSCRDGTHRQVDAGPALPCSPAFRIAASLFFCVSCFLLAACLPSLH